MENHFQNAFENDETNFNCYLKDNLNNLYQDPNLKKKDHNSKKLDTAKNEQIDSTNKQILGLQSCYLNTPNNTYFSLRENSNNLTLSRNDDILISNFRPFSNNVTSIGSNNSNNIINSNKNTSSHQSFSAISYNSQPTLSTSSTNSRLTHENIFSNNSNQFNPQIVATSNSSDNSTRLSYSCQRKNQSEVLPAENANSNKYDKHFISNKSSVKPFEDINQIDSFKKRQTTSSNYNRSNSFANTNYDSSLKKRNFNYEEQEYYKKWNSQGKYYKKDKPYLIKIFARVFFS